MNCGSYRGEKLLEHGMKVIERVLQRRIRALVDIDEAQFSLCLERVQLMPYS